MGISAGTLILALRAINRDIKTLERVLGDASLSDEEAEPHNQELLELTKAFSELAWAYEQTRQTDPDLPALDDVIPPGQGR